MSKNSIENPSYGSSTTVRTKIRVPQVPKFNVVMYNDDVTTFEFVIDVLISIFDKDEFTAHELTNKIDREGSCIVGRYSKEIAETRVEQTIERARKEGFPLGYLLVVNKAIRDEGTSYHYIRPSRYIDLDENCVLDIKSVLDEEGFSYEVITTWTTDGFYRETLDRKNKRVREGATAVDMECSAFAAVAKFRNIEFGELMYSGDSLAGPNYDRRNWMGITDVRKKVLELTIKAILKR